MNVCSTQFGTHLVKVLVRTGDPPAGSAEAVATAEAAAEAAAEEEEEEAASVDPLRAAAEAAAAAAAAAEEEEEEGEAADVSDGDLMDVVCPPELGADRKLRIALPDGRLFDVIVPDGIAEGDLFRVGPFPRNESG